MSSKLKPSSQSSYYYSSSSSSLSLPRPLVSQPLWSSTRYKRNPIKRNRQRLFKMKLHKTSSVNSTSQMEHEPAAATAAGNGVARSRYERNGNDYDDQGACQYQHDCGQFIVDKSCSSSYRYKNILASRSVPILFILVCFLVIANTNCDHASSTNDLVTNQKPYKSSLESTNNLNIQNDPEPTQQQAAIVVHIKKSASAPIRIKSDPLMNVLREIYFDENSKVTMLLPDELGTVQKFHPNGRYGRRSVDNFAEQHDELGKLDDQSDLSRTSAGSSPMSNTVVNGAGSSLSGMLKSIGHDLDLANARLNSNAAATNSRGTSRIGLQLRQQLANQLADRQDEKRAASTGTNYQLEMSKLLRCNYSGLSNLYWCESSSSPVA